MEHVIVYEILSLFTTNSSKFKDSNWNLSSECASKGGASSGGCANRFGVGCVCKTDLNEKNYLKCLIKLNFSYSWLWW